MVQMVRSACYTRRPRLDPWVGRTPWRRKSAQLEQAGSLPAASEDRRQRRNVQLQGEGNRCQEGKGLDSLLNAALLQVGSGAGGLRVRLRTRAV